MQMSKYLLTHTCTGSRILPFLPHLIPFFFLITQQMKNAKRYKSQGTHSLANQKMCFSFQRMCRVKMRLSSFSISFLVARMHLRPRWPGRLPDRQRLLGALLVNTRFHLATPCHAMTATSLIIIFLIEGRP